MSGLTTISRRSFLIMTAALAACKPGSEILKLSGPTMGTTYNVTAVNHGAAIRHEDLGGAVEIALGDVNRQMSNWDPASELSRLNAAPSGETLRLSAELHHVLRGAEAVHRASDGRFDVTVGPLIDLWGFGAGPGAPRLPAEAQISAIVEKIGQDRVLSLREDGTVSRTVEGAGVYLSAIAKGHGVDRVAQVLRDFGLRDFMVEIGGDIFVSGLNGSGTPWQIGIEIPTAAAGGVHRVLGVSGMGMATSGDYRNYFEADGTRYSHIIDPTTGRPITHDTVSATVLAADAMLADAWATAMLTLGRARGLEIAEDQGLAVLFIETGPGGLVTTESSRLAAAIA